MKIVEGCYELSKARKSIVPEDEDIIKISSVETRLSWCSELGNKIVWD